MVLLHVPFVSMFELVMRKCMQLIYDLVFLQVRCTFYSKRIKNTYYFLEKLLRKSDVSLERLFSHHKHFLSLLRKLPLIKHISEVLQKDLALNFKIMVVKQGLFHS